MDLGEKQLGPLEIADQKRGDHAIGTVVRHRNPLRTVQQVQVRFDRSELEPAPTGDRFEAPASPIEALPDVVERDDLEVARRRPILGERDWKSTRTRTEVDDPVSSTDLQCLDLSRHHRLIGGACGQQLDTKRSIPTDEIVPPEGLEICSGIRTTQSLRQPQLPNHSGRR